jgi:DNA-binding response OmpR family regulator
MAIESLAAAVDPDAVEIIETYDLEQPLKMLAAGEGGVFDQKLERLEQDERFTLDRAWDPATALRLAQDQLYSVVLARHNSVFDGIGLCRDLRSVGVETPVLLLTDCDNPETVMAGLEAGADCCVADPITNEELVARLRALHRRTEYSHSMPLLRVGDLRLDPRRHAVYKGDARVELSEWEYVLLRYLMRHEGQVVPRRYILARLREDSDALVGLLDACILALRAKLADAPGNSPLKEVGSLGYLIERETTPRDRVAVQAVP